MPAPALLIAIPLVIGVALGVLCTRDSSLPAIACVLACAGAAVAFGWRRAAHVAWLAVVGALCAGVVIGARAERDAQRPSLLDWVEAHAQGDAPLRIAGVLREDAAPGPQSVGLALDVIRVDSAHTDAAVAGGVRLAVAGALAPRQAPAWRAGRTVSVTVALRPPLDYGDPGVPSDRVRLARQGTVLLGTVKSAALVTVTGRGSFAQEAASAVRAFVRRAVSDAVGRWSLKSAGVVTAILIGDRSGLDPADERRLQDAGTYHVIAISGGNVALLTLLLVAIGRMSGLSPRTVAAGAVALLVFYGYAAGLAPSVMRATLAGALYLTGRALDRHGPALNALAVAGACAGAFAPLTVVDPGFILSFGATAGIIVAAARLVPPRTRGHEASRARRMFLAIRHAGWELGAATLCAEIALGPVGARLFGRVSVAGLVLNFAAIPLMSVIQVAGMAAVGFAPVLPVVSVGFGWIAHVCTAGLIWSAGLVDALPWLVVDVPPPAWWVIAAWYGGWAGVLVSRGWLRGASLLVAVSSAVLVLSGPNFERSTLVPAPAAGWSRIAIADVGQGDAAIVWPAGGDPFMVDAGGVPGGGFDVGRRVTLPVAWALGVRRLSFLLLSHGDPDHIGGGPAVLRALAPLDVRDGVPVPSHVPLQQLHALAVAARVPWLSLQCGDAFDTGAAHVRVLNPPVADWERPKVRNDDSVVLDIRIGGVSIVLPGDIASPAEQAVIPLLTPSPLTIVKAPHHGSAGSSSPPFVAALHPAAVIFSAGRRNAFGHPAPAVVDRYRASGAAIFRTDEDGAVFVDTDGKEVVVWTWGSKRSFGLLVPASRPDHEIHESMRTRKDGNYGSTGSFGSAGRN